MKVRPSPSTRSWMALLCEVLPSGCCSFYDCSHVLLHAGESIPIRLFLSPFDLTPTYRNINSKFSLKYYLNLVLVDEEDRRYFKQQVWFHPFFLPINSCLCDLSVLFRKLFYGERPTRPEQRPAKGHASTRGMKARETGKRPKERKPESRRRKTTMKNMSTSTANRSLFSFESSRGLRFGTSDKSTFFFGNLKQVAGK